MSARSCSEPATSSWTDLRVPRVPGHRTAPRGHRPTIRPDDEENELTVNDHARDDELVVYGTGWCPDVRRSRALLDAARVPYRYVDVDEDQAATDLIRGLQRGRRRIPTLVWPDGSFLVEPTDDELRAHLTGQGHEPGGLAG